ncbi:aminopeptidase P family protein [Ancylomarina euxinus]|uniref:Aminopeptidase P family protein n=1 Tax=Ancylomarina euxinus TaxID=2283627 RepID=A0A425Y1N0_9BACT|nr:aminopeptidase P family protein [Ancylomarina euxinus]MCZ4695179.1 aminopeptidase P family protein [Ancylomarina euxinus]MUP14887.1 M24 family metallopeptidase [Ancylomarina euxinus]RRG21782.1 aminopeptidase P family protein [Ancylomarina euxinus]
MTIFEKVNALRSLMEEKEIHAYIITSSDPHMSEYVPEYWTARQWISGFTGSAGTVVVTRKKAGLWTDSRYFLQAEKELEGSGITLFKMGIPGVPNQYQWLLSELESEANIGFDGTCFSIAQSKELKNSLADISIHINEEGDLINEIWSNRPSLPNHKIFEHPVEFAGKSRKEKLAIIRNEMHQLDAKHHFVGSLDDIAWIFNLRGQDVDFNPVAIAYALINEDSCTLYLDQSKLDDELIFSLNKDGILTSDYNQICNDLEELRGSENVLLDSNRSNLKIYRSITANIIEKENPSQLLKSQKNLTEIKGMKQAMLQDGLALTQFFCWLEENLGKTIITEFTLIDKLREFRSRQKHFMGESFGSIVAYKAHGASPHYSTTTETDCEIKAEGILLIDSGGQYMNGTTDITRTTALGELSPEDKMDFTLVLKGMIQMTLAVFPKGTRGCNIDILARQALWMYGKNYGHGTGHGVGCFLNVHEGPQSIRQELKDQAILPGMISSNEPGFYKEGAYGIRHENLILCKEKLTTKYGEFLEFDTLTLFPFDTKALDINLLSEIEKSWLNHYHQKVYDSLAPQLDEKHKAWLKNKTQAI